MKRDFSKWLATFRNSICDYNYYVDFEKVFVNVDSIKIELNILNSLIGSKNIESDFEKLLVEYPQILKCIPALLAVRGREIYTIDGDGEYLFNFKTMNYSVEEYKMFMRKTGLFDLISNHIINNLVDYVTGVEVGLDSNGRKNRGGHLMENLVEEYIQKAEKQTLLAMNKTIENALLRKKVDDGKVSRASRLVNKENIIDEHGEIDENKLNSEIEAIIKEFPELIPTTDAAKVGFKVGGDGKQDKPEDDVSRMRKIMGLK